MPETVTDTDLDRRGLPQRELEEELEKRAGELAERFHVAEEAELEHSLAKAADALGKDATVTQFLPILAARKVEDALREGGEAPGR